MLISELAVDLLEVQSLFGVAHLLQQPVLNIDGLVRYLHGLRELLQVKLGELLEVGLLLTLTVLLHPNLELLIHHIRGAERDLVRLLLHTV